jgi:hypothetical protein
VIKGFNLSQCEYPHLSLLFIPSRFLRTKIELSYSSMYSVFRWVLTTILTTQICSKRRY